MRYWTQKSALIELQTSPGTEKKVDRLNVKRRVAGLEPRLCAGDFEQSFQVLVGDDELVRFFRFSVLNHAVKARGRVQLLTRTRSSSNPDP